MLSPVSTRAALFGATLAAFSIGAVANADAAPGDSKKPVAVRIASPKPNALVRAEAVPVKIVTGPQVKTIRVFDGTRDLAGRFSRTGSVWRAKLSLKPGTHTLLVQSTGRRDSGDVKRVQFVVGRSAPASAKVHSGAVASKALSAGPVGTHGYQPTAGALPVTVHTKAASIAKLTVNGHRVADKRSREFLSDHSWLVSVRDGLRVGTNRLVMESYDQQGRHAVKRWTVKRGSRLPLAEAGLRERTIKPSAWTRLDGTGTKATKRGAKVTYAWRVVQAPKGAKPKLRDADTATPRFKPDVKGFYQVALKVSQMPRRTAGAAAAPGAAEDVVTLSAWPQLPEQGMYVDTGFYGSDDQHTAPYNALWFWGSAYPAFTDDPNECLQFDDQTLGTVDYGMPKDMQPEQGRVTVCAWGATSLTGGNAISWMPFTQGNGSAIWIDNKLVAYNGSNTNWDPDTGNPTSNLHGWLKPADGPSGHPSWVDSDMLKVQTRAAGGTATSNTIDVNGTGYTVNLGSNQTGGFELLTLDNTGAPTGDPTLYGFTGVPADEQTTESNLAAALRTAATNHNTVLLQGFGTLPNFVMGSPLMLNQPATAGVSAVGGRPDVLGRVNGSKNSNNAAYALIAGAYTAPNGTVSWRAKEVSSERTGTGSANALLVRDSSADDYIPFTSDTAASSAVGQGHNDLLPLVYQAPASWADWMPDGNGGLRAASGAEQAAFNDIQTALENDGSISAGNYLCPTAPDAVRGSLCNSNATQLTNDAGTVRALNFSSFTPNGAYTSNDFANAQNAIATEFSNASTIRSSLNDYQAIFGTVNQTGAVNASTIAGWITGDIAKSGATTTTNYSAFLSALTDMWSGLLSGDDMAEEAAAMTFNSGAFGLDSNLMPDSTPTQDLENQIQVTQSTAVANLTYSTEHASQQLDVYGDYLASDPVKLQQGARMFAGEYGMSGDAKNDAENAAQYATEQYLWGTLLAPAYAVWQGPAVLGANPACFYSDPPTYQGFPFSNLDANGLWSSYDSGSGIHPQQWWIGENMPGYEWIQDQDKVGLPPSSTDKLFGAITLSTAPTAQTNVGATMPYFALNYLRQLQLPLNPSYRLPATQSGCMPDPYTN